MVPNLMPPMREPTTPWEKVDSLSLTLSIFLAISFSLSLPLSLAVFLFLSISHFLPMQCRLPVRGWPLPRPLGLLPWRHWVSPKKTAATAAETPCNCVLRWTWPHTAGFWALYPPFATPEAHYHFPNIYALATDYLKNNTSEYLSGY